MTPLAEALVLVSVVGLPLFSWLTDPARRYRRQDRSDLRRIGR